MFMCLKPGRERRRRCLLGEWRLSLGLIFLAGCCEEVGREGTKRQNHSEG